MKQVCVIGLGQFGSHLARTLVKMGCEVLVIDLNEKRIDELRDDVHRALIGDARDEEMLRSIVGGAIDEVVICLGQRTLESSILCALHLSHLGVKTIRSTANNDDHAEILRAVGATEIIFPERDAAERTARRIANPDLRDLFPLAGDYRIMEIVAPDSMHGKTLNEADLRKTYDLLVLAVRPKNSEQYRFLPGAETIIAPEEVLMVLGRELDLARFSAMQ